MADTSKIFLRQARIGPMANFVYLIGDPATRKLAVVDPAWDVEAIRKFAEAEGYEIGYRPEDKPKSGGGCGSGGCGSCATRKS